MKCKMNMEVQEAYDIVTTARNKLQRVEMRMTSQYTVSIYEISCEGCGINMLLSLLSLTLMKCCSEQNWGLLKNEPTFTVHNPLV
jgi:hypothetical protein